MDKCIFCRINRGEIPKEFDYEDGRVMVFPDIHPVRPVHLLIVPREHIEDFFHVEDETLYSHIAGVIKKLIEKNGLMGKGYRIEVNGGGHQLVDHLHFHLIGPMKKG